MFNNMKKNLILASAFGFLAIPLIATIATQKEISNQKTEAFNNDGLQNLELDVVSNESLLFEPQTIKDNLNYQKSLPFSMEIKFDLFDFLQYYDSNIQYDQTKKQFYYQKRSDETVYWQARECKLPNSGGAMDTGFDNQDDFYVNFGDKSLTMTLGDHPIDGNNWFMWEDFETLELNENQLLDLINMDNSNLFSWPTSKSRISSLFEANNELKRSLTNIYNFLSQDPQWVLKNYFNAQGEDGDIFYDNYFYEHFGVKITNEILTTLERLISTVSNQSTYFISKDDMFVPEGWQARYIFLNGYYVAPNNQTKDYFLGTIDYKVIAYATYKVNSTLLINIEGDLLNTFSN